MTASTRLASNAKENCVCIILASTDTRRIKARRVFVLIQDVMTVIVHEVVPDGRKLNISGRLSKSKRKTTGKRNGLNIEENHQRKYQLGRFVRSA
jgi:hypothetical protein